MTTDAWTSRLSLRGRFPLLVKDLTEMASRKRTYVVRVVYAALLFGIYGLILKATLGRFSGGSVYGIMGRGREVFQGAMVLQFGGLFLFLPALMSSAITGEKEREALPLILLTDLRPWEIVLEKYVGRMVPMAVFLLLGLPLVALAYSLGGVSLAQIILLAYFLFITLLQVGALSLMISAWCRTSVSAFIASYLGLLALYFGPPLTIYFVLGLHNPSVQPVAFALCPPIVMAEAMSQPRMAVGMAAAGEVSLYLTISTAFLLSLPTLFSAAIFLIMARLFLLRRAAVKSSNYVLGLFRRLDAFFTRINTITGGIVLIRDKTGFPAEDPVFWRETSRKSLGKLNYLLRVLLVIEMPVILIGMIATFDNRYYTHDVVPLSVMLFFLWTVVALAVVVRGADAVPSERSAQTLGVLLTTPMTGAQIIKEKMRAVRRLAIVGAVPLVTLILMEWHAEYGGRWGDDAQSTLYLIGSVLTVAVYLPMLYWLGLFVGGKMRSRAKAIIAALIVLVFWCGAVPLLLVAGEVLFHMGIDRPPVSLVFLASPGAMILGLEINDVGRQLGRDIGGIYVPLLLNTAFYGLAWFLLRNWCLARADNILGRTPAGKNETASHHGGPRRTTENDIPV